MKLKKFESFEQEKEKYLSITDIKDIFSELIDHDYSIEFLDKNISYFGMYYVVLKKEYSEEFFNYIDKGRAYGNEDISKIKKEVDIAFESLETTKQRFIDIGYTIAHELEFNFSAGSLIHISCHIQHSKYDNEY
jgi:hypothetical protein